MGEKHMTPTMAEVDQAAAALQEAKDAYAQDPSRKDEYLHAKRVYAELRTAYRQQNGPDPAATVSPDTLSVGSGVGVLGEEE